ncbi:amino acid adenylation domain-containing protein [Nitrospirillum amazonense]|uniref:Amino acid adenylation domain-containing protein n=1 Tax=Nitrospirillum amazonense TaxID=28077 RepID=A0A560EMW8_9PROT|nr:non-ribosomal peptide synthetase [Nitrospirillum amazonense]TWB10729.1 amino acid adenylation domain-containing protein [Nitrospirillum amazonense]
MPTTRTAPAAPDCPPDHASDAPQPLGEEQRALWAAYRAAPGEAGYIMAYAGALLPGTAPHHLASAFTHVIAGHETLSSAYGEDAAGTPVMRPLRTVTPDVAIVTTPFADDESRAAWLAAQADAPLDLEAGQVCRVRVLVEDAGAHVVVAVHHIAGDFLAMESLTGQVMLAYERLVQGLAPATVPTGRYRAWVDRQRATLAGARGQKLETFWRTLLTDPPAELELPSDGGDDSGTHESEIALSPETTAALRTLAGRLDIGLFPLLATLYHVFLGRWTGRERFLIGTPVSGRMGAADRDLIGCTVNALPWPVDLRGDPAFADLARRTQATFMAMLRHHRLPLARIAAAIGRGGALFQHMTTYVPVGERGLMNRYIPHLRFATQRGGANDLNLRWVDGGDRLTLQWRQDTGRYSPATVARMRRGFMALVDQVLAAPEARISTLRAQTNGDAAVLSGPVAGADTALALFHHHVNRTPHRTAVECGTDSLSFTALDARAATLAGRLAAAGVRPGDTVGLHLPRGVDLAVAMIAVWKTGAAYLCLDPALPPARLALMATDAAVRLVVGDGVPAELTPPRLAVTGQQAPSAPPPPATPSLPAYVIYTSGSTGAPKGVVVTQGNLAAYALGVLDALDLPAEATLTTLAAVTADLGYTAWFGALLGGRTLRIIDTALADDPDALARHLAERPVDALKIVPSHLAALMAVPQPAHLLPRRRLVLGGEVLSAEFVARVRALAPECQVVNHYGPTETTVGCLTWRAGDTDEAGVPVGRPLAGAHVMVLDHHLEAVPVGVPGELAVGGAGVASGYRNRPGLTAQRFVPDPAVPGGRLYLTGDRVVMTPDGAIRFLGRADDQVKIRGFRVELGEVEAHLRRLPGVVEAAVVARSTAPGATGLRLVAFVAGRDLPEPGALVRALADQVPDAMVPASLTVLPALPRLPNGKIDRAALPAETAPRDAAASAGTGLSPVETALCALWAEVLGRPAVGVADDFFAIGGDSILALQVIAKARPQGLALTPKMLFQKRTVAAVAAALAALPAKAPKTATIPVADPPPFALSGLGAESLAALKADRPDVVDAYPLSPLQQGLLFHSLLDGASGAYVNQLVLDATGPFAPEAFAHAWQAAVDAHPLLRTAFRWEGLDAPLQLVQRTATLPVSRHDWRAWDDGAQETALAGFLATDRAQGFVLEAAPLMRLAVMDRGDGRWWLVWSRHHLVVDGWCSILLLDEVLERYRAQLAGEAPHLPHRRPFRDHVAWLARQDTAQPLAFWTNFLAGVQDAPPLPVLRPAQPGPALPLNRTLVLDRSETARLTAAARDLGVTLNTLVQGAWGRTLAALSGRDDVVFGVTSAGRSMELAGADAMLGVFITTLPLRMKPAAGRRLGDYLRAVQADNVAMREHEHAALADIQKHLGGGTLFDTLLVFQNLPMLEGRRRRVGALDLRQRQNVERTHYGLTVEVFPGEELGVALDADARRIDEAALARVADGFRATLLGMARGANTPLGGLPTLGAAEMALLRRWRTTAADYVLQPDWVARVADRVARHPDRVVARCDGATLSYAQLWERSERLARGLSAAGLTPDGIVALLLPRGLELLTMMVAVLRAGGAWLPLDPAHPPARWAQVIGQAKAILVRDPAIPCDLPSLAPADLLDRAAEGALPMAAPDGRQLAYVLFTSGSTGAPKGVMVSRDGMLNNMLAKVGPLGLGEGDVIAQTAPACFDISVWQTLMAPLLGAVVEIIPDAVVKDPDALLDRLRTAAVTVFEPVPSLMRALVESDGVGAGAIPLRALRWVLPTGEALGANDARAWFAAYPDVPLMNAYGPAECADDVAFHALHHAPEPGTVIPIGRPTANADLRVLDNDLSPTPVGAVGEIVVGGVGVGRGYSGDPRRTAAAFVPDPDGPPGARVYRTGDLGRWTADGLLEWAGRKDFQVKLRGFRIEPGEVEAVLERHPGVRRAAVVARGDRLVAYWQATGNEITSDDLARHAAAHLPPYMVPAQWIPMTAWPLNANGKLDRKALPQPGMDLTAGEAPATETERLLAGLWRELLPVEAVSRDSDFFAAGGHSLLAARLVARLRRLGWDGLALRTVFEAPVLRQLAARLDADTATDGVSALPTLRPVPRIGPLPLSPAQQRLWLLDRLTGGDAAYSMAATLDLRGDLDVQALEDALNAVIARHEILRTAYPENDADEDGAPVAVPVASLTLPLPVEDLSGLPAAERDACALALREADMGRPFDLAQGPPLRARLLRLAPGHHQMVFAMHHMVADGWSVGVLTRDLSTAYRAALAGTAPDWPPLPVQYADYAVWQQALLSGEGLRGRLAFWRGHLAGAPTQLRLPTDRPRPPVAQTAGGALRFTVPPDLLARLGAWARTRGATPFMALLAGFQALLHQVTGDDDLVVGTDTAGRPVPEVEELIGFFVNVVPLRSRRRPGMTPADMLDQTRHTALAAFDQDALPFDRIVEAVGVPRDRSRNPLVQALFVLQNVPEGGFDLPGLAVTQLPALERRSKFDLALFLEPQGAGGADGMAADWVYATALFDPATIARFHQDWIALLRHAVDAPDQPLPIASPKASTMTTATQRLNAKLARLGAPATRPATAPLEPEAVRQSFLTPGATFPVVLEPAAGGLDPSAWAAANRPLIDGLLARHAGILFRGFDLPGAQAFEGFAEAMEPGGLFGGYGDLPKKEGGRNTYRSTPYPERQMILFHNESAHLDRWPRKQWFYAEQVAPVGGCTPIVDCRQMMRRLPADLITDLERRGLLYVRTFTPRLDVGWRDFFKSEDRDAVTARCAAGGIDCRWLDPETPQTRSRGPAVIRHPLTGERSFFNQVQLHHPHCLDADVREDLLDLVGIDRFPRNVLYGDDTPIPDAVMARIGEAYEACAVRFDWRNGDVVMLDNMLAAHARDPYEGPRRVVVAMGAMTDRASLAASGTAEVA